MEEYRLVIDGYDLVDSHLIRIITNKGDFYFYNNILYWGEPRDDGLNKVPEPEIFQKRLFEDLLNFVNNQNKTYNSVIVSSIIQKNLN